MDADTSLRFDVVVLGASAGGIRALRTFLAGLGSDFPVPVVVCLHVAARSQTDYAVLFPDAAVVAVREAADKEDLVPGVVLVGPPGYHVLVERERVVSLSADDAVNWARPSIDVLFDSAAWAFGPRAIGILLTGASSDGAEGLSRIHARGGTTFVQDPADAQFPEMPASALRQFNPTAVVTLGDLACRLRALFPRLLEES